MKAARQLPVIFHLCAYLALVLPFTLILSTTPADAAWLPDGALVCGAPEAGEAPHIASDDAGGAFVVWEDTRDSGAIYGQRIDGSGNPCWAPEGILISDYGSYNMIDLISDGVGGAIAVYISGGTISAQRFDAGGNLLWSSMGIEVTGSLSLALEDILVIPDGLGGFITVFKETGYIYAQRVDSHGNLSWDEVSDRGALVCGTQDYFDIISDQMGGVFVTFSNESSPRIYVQRVYASGAVWGLGGIFFIYDFHELRKSSITSDGQGGVIVVYQVDEFGWDLGAQRVDGAGNILWGIWGVPVCRWDQDQYDPDILSDGMGGAYIVWEDSRDQYAHTQIYAQHIDMYGTTLWAQTGILIGDDDDHQHSPGLLECGSGRVIATWVNAQEDACLTGQKIGAGRSIMWDAGGVFVARGYAGEYDLCSDGAGGLFTTFVGQSVPVDGIYAQYLDYKGDVPAPHPTIISVTDVPADQGGAVRLTVAPSEYDDMDQVFVRVARYDVWQRVDGDLYPMTEAFPGTEFPSPATTQNENAIVRSGNEDLIVESDGTRYLLTAPSGAIPAGTWEIVGSFAASQSSEYIYRTTTLSDSTASGIPYNVYIVSAHTEDPGYWYVSAPDSGYSVDNLAPAPPLGLAGEQLQSPAGLQLSWDQNTENDFWYYAVYRSTSETFTPGPGNLVATPEGESWFDNGWDWQTDYWYKLAAVDENGNESGYIVLGPGEVTGEEPPAPLASYLSQNYPNPFNPTTTIAFGLSHDLRVKLSIYDTAGRLVRVVLDEDRAPGHYKINWNGLTASGQRAASGVYFYKLTANEFIETRKMVLLK